MIFVLVIITFRVIIFSLIYLSINNYYRAYFLLLLMFVSSIIIILLSNSYLIIIISWDLLGMTRILLILFYGRWDRVLGSIRTFITIRFGDYFLLFGLGFLYYQVIDFNSFLIPFLIILFLILATFTKRAQFPFIG
jgi:NADH-quinone oxidoreductase subunit L